MLFFGEYLLMDICNAFYFLTLVRLRKVWLYFCLSGKRKQALLGSLPAAGKQPVRNILTDWNGHQADALKLQPFSCAHSKSGCLKKPINKLLFSFPTQPVMIPQLVF